MDSNKKILLVFMIVVIVIGVGLGFIFKDNGKTNTTTVNTVANKIENKVVNEVKKENTVVENKVENTVDETVKTTTETPTTETFTESPKSDGEKAIKIVKDKYGEGPNLEFEIASWDDGTGRIVVVVTDSNTTRNVFYRVDVKNNTCEIQY